jgi:hypothetical protein
MERSVSLAPVVDHNLVPVLGDHRNLNPALLDDAERIARRTVLFEDDCVPGIELHGQVPGYGLEVIVVEKLKGRHLFQESHHVFEDDAAGILFWF